MWQSSGPSIASHKHCRASEFASPECSTASAQCDQDPVVLPSSLTLTARTHPGPPRPCDTLGADSQAQLCIPTSHDLQQAPRCLLVPKLPCVPTQSPIQVAQAPGASLGRPCVHVGDPAGAGWGDSASRRGAEGPLSAGLWWSALCLRAHTVSRCWGPAAAAEGRAQGYTRC